MIQHAHSLFIKVSTVILLVIGATTTAPIAVANDTVASLFGQKQTSKFLPVHQAFKVDVMQKDDALVATFNITPEHYIYKDKLSLDLPQGITAGTWQFSKSSTMVDDPEFGKVAVFEQDVVATIKLDAKQHIQQAPIAVKWQGCAKAGLCYPPETTKLTLSLTAQESSDQTVAKTPKTELLVVDGTNVSHTKQTEQAFKPSTITQAKKEDDKSILDNAKPILQGEQKVSVLSADDTNAPNDKKANELATTASTEQAPSFIMTPVVDTTSTQAKLSQNTQTTTDDTQVTHTLSQDNDPFGINKHPVVAVFLLFLAGLLLSFTPCVYPMIPIVANIVARQEQLSSKKGFALSSSYGLGVATAYGLLGAIVAWIGKAVGLVGWLQNPYVLGVFALVFVVLALAMFDVLTIGLPTKLKNALQSKSQLADNKLGSVGGSFLAGVLSALVVSPCVSFPMAGALTAISTSGSVPFGFLALFMLGLGLSLPLMLLGAVQGGFMPKAGNWMTGIKEFCGILLFAVSLSLIERLTLSPMVLILWAVWFAFVAVWLWQFVKLPAKTLAIISVIWSVCLMVGASMGQDDPWRPLGKISVAGQNNTLIAKPDIRITTLQELDEILLRHDKVLVDITATWCIECRIMEKTLFANRSNMLQEYQVVKLDITDTTQDSKAVLQRYQLFGPPALLLYKNGQLKNILLGEVKKDQLDQTLSAL